MKELVCICCPRGCNLTIDEDGKVSGNFCPKGKEYALEETSAPKRTLTTFIRVQNRKDTMLSVKTSGAIPKEKMGELMAYINVLKVKAPIQIGDVIVTDILGLGVNLVATKNIL
ncbi:MAG: DUF1667 domain-containing protein [Coprobacillus sp.]|nr:DUF1667 domain-containing protein [Coprobacillus sp.]